MNRCPAPDCDRVIAKRQLLCPDHWAEVPEALRQRVHDLRRTPDDAAYTQAVRDVLAHVARVVD